MINLKNQKKKKKKMEENSPLLSNQTRFVEKSNKFISFPRNVKEEIFSNLDFKTIFKLKGVCKDWKKTIEKPKYEKLSKRYLKAKEEKETYFDRKKFYKSSFFLTSKLLIKTHSNYVPLHCCYGKMWCLTQSLCFWCKKKNKTKKKKENQIKIFFLQ